MVSADPAPHDVRLELPLGQLPSPDAGIGDAERSRRLTEVLDQIEDDHARAATAAAMRTHSRRDEEVTGTSVAR